MRIDAASAGAVLRTCVALALTLLPLPASPAESGRPSNAEILFRLANPCPATGLPHGPCQGYVLDRLIPIFCGGAEDPANMRWLTLAEAKEKNRWEKIGCRKGRKLVLPGQSEPVTESFALGEAPPAVEVQALPPQ